MNKYTSLSLTIIIVVLLFTITQCSINESRLRYQKEIEEIKYKTDFGVCVGSCPSGFWDSYDEKDQECVDKCIRGILRCN